MTNTRISSDSKTSQVILEFFVCEDISTASAEKNELNILEFKRHPDLEEVSVFNFVQILAILFQLKFIFKRI